MSRKDGFVYVIGIGFDKLYKIGWSRSVRQRLDAFQAVNPRARIIISIWCANAVDAEHELHKMFANQRRKRELFFLKLADFDKIKAFLETQTPSYKRAERQQNHNRNRRKPKLPPPNEHIVSDHVLRRRPDASTLYGESTLRHSEKEGC